MAPLLHRAAITKATPCVEVWQTSDLRSLRLGEEKKEDRWKKEGKKLQGKNIMAPLLHRAAITKAHIENQKKNLLDSNISPTCPHNMVNFGPLEAEIGSVVWGTQANFNGFRVLASLLHGIRACLLYTSPSPRDRQKSRMPSSA